jgi:aryl sulfotransferase
VLSRDPRDVYCSGLNHRDNMTDTELAFNIFTSGKNGFTDWLDKEQQPGGWDTQSLQLTTHFLQTYWDFKELPNVHMFHYSDMKRDLKGSIADMASALNVALDEKQLEAMTQAASFESMKQNAEQFAPESGREFWKQDRGFFANGSSGQWQDIFSAEQVAAFDARLGELVSPEQAEWLLNGGAVSR